MRKTLLFALLAVGLGASAFAQDVPPPFDWTAIGVDLITRFVPVLVVVTVYFVRGIFATLPPLVVNIIAIVLAQAYSYITALIANGTFDPIQAAALAGLATLLAELLKNTGATRAVKNAVK